MHAASASCVTACCVRQLARDRARPLWRIKSEQAGSVQSVAPGGYMSFPTAARKPPHRARAGEGSKPARPQTARAAPTALGSAWACGTDRGTAIPSRRWAAVAAPPPLRLSLSPSSVSLSALAHPTPWPSPR
eukprot:5429077-Pleurochrysis_carterae.AAC.7